MKWPCLLFLLIPAASLAQVPDTYKADFSHEASQDALKPGDVNIPAKYRIRNNGPQCVWASASTICLAAGYHALDEGTVERAGQTGWHGAGIGFVKKAFDTAHIPYRYQPPQQRGQNGYIFIDEKGKQTTSPVDIYHAAMKEGVGCYIQTWKHALVCCGIDDKSARILDNNGPAIVKEWSLQEFESRTEHCGIFPILRRNRDCPNCNVPSGPKPLPLNPNQPVEPDPVKPAETVKPVDPQQPAVDPNTAILKAISDLGTRLSARQDAQDKRLDGQDAKIASVKPGRDGSDGKAGAVGATGANGKDGASGRDGLNGVNGKDADIARVTLIEQRLAALEQQVSQGGQYRLVPINPTNPK